MAIASAVAAVPSIGYATGPIRLRHPASIGSTVSRFLHSAGEFFGHLTNLQWSSVLIGLLLYTAYLTLRSRALWGAVSVAYPNDRVRWRDVWGAYMAGYAVNNVIPLGGGNIVQLFLTRSSIERGSYPTVAVALWTGVLFDWGVGVLVMCFAFTQGVFPKPPDFSKLPAFDISFFASHPRFALFTLTAFGAAFLVAFALLSARVRAFWQRVRQGLTVVRDRALYRRTMVPWQAASWVARFGAYWALLDAFHIGGSVRNALLVLGVQVVASVFPFTPGGAGVQQALLVEIFTAGHVDAATVAAFSVGQQIATAVLSAGLGFGALVFIFRFRSFREVIDRGRAHRADEAARGAARSPVPSGGDGGGSGAERQTGATEGAEPRGDRRRGSRGVRRARL
jgi:uncharacterized membrane protein YbhN (UPF0104 family)